MAETGWQNKPIHFQYGEDLIKKLRATDSTHINAQNGIVYFDSANRQIILGQDNTGTNGTGTNYKIYSDLYQTLFYANAYDEQQKITDGHIIEILIADVTKNFLKQNMTALRVNFQIDIPNSNLNSTNMKTYYLITNTDKASLSSLSGSTYTSEFKKLAVKVTITDDLICVANNFLDFMYIPTSTLKLMGMNQKLNFVGEKTNRLVWTNENSITVSKNHYADASHIAIASTEYQKVLAGAESTEKTDFTLLVNGKLYADEHIYTPVGFYVRRPYTGGGFVLFNSAIETARLSNTTLGTKDVIGKTTLVLGNSTASGTNKNARGALCIYGTNTYSQTLYANTSNLTASRSVYFSDYDGTAYLAHVGGADAVGTSTKPVYVAANGRITAGQETYVLTGGTAIAKDADLNTIKTIGNYYCSQTATAKTILNNPYATTASTSMAAFTLKVEAAVGSGTQYLKQTLKFYNSSVEAQRHSTDSGSSWNSWRFNVFKNSDSSKTVGSTSQPVYVTKTGEITAITGAIANDITGNAATATEFEDSSKIKLTGAVTGEASSKGGSTGWTISTTIPNNSITNDKLVNKSIIIAGNTIDLGGSIFASKLRSSLGLSNAMHFIGKATVAITDGSTTDPKISGYAFSLGSSGKQQAGDVIIDKDSAFEYVWTINDKWERLGGDSSYALSGHTHGNITNGGTLDSDTAIANGDKIVITDASDSNKIARSPITFDGSTETQGLTPKGTWVNYAGGTAVTLNNVSKAKTTASFYAPTSGGTANYVLLGNGTTAAPIWKAPKDTANILLNALGVGESIPVDADYYISQYVGGGDTTTTYHRRPMSALWSYIKAKTDAAYKTIQSTVSNPSARGTSVTFIASITQNANGVITATRKTVSTMGAASASEAGSTGLVPAPQKGNQLCFLRGDGTWVVPTDTNTHYTTHLYAGGSGATANTAITSGNIYLRLFDNTTHRDDIQLKSGTNMHITSNASGEITFTAIDTKVTQSASTTEHWRKILLHYKDDANYNTDVTASTGQVYASKEIAIQPFSGNLRTAGSIQATGFISPGISSSWYQSNVNALIRQTTVNGWSPIMTLKTKNGWWNLGSRGDESSYYDHLIFGFLSDADASGVGTNHMDYSVRLIPQFSTLNDSTSRGRAFVVAPYSSNSAAVGAGTKPIYISAEGLATASSSTVGGAAKPVYMSSGTITACNSTVGSETQLVYMSSGTITASTTTVGAATKPIWLENGILQPGSYELKATVNSGTANRITYYSDKNAISSGTITTNGGYLGNVSYLSINTAHQTNYVLYVNGNTFNNGINYFGNGTTYYINNSATAYLNGITSSTNVSARSEASFISSSAGTPWPHIRFDTRAGGSTYITTDQSTWGQIYCQVPAKRASDSGYYSTRFFFREYSKTENTTTRLNHYEDYYLPAVNNNRTSDGSYSILTSKDLSFSITGNASTATNILAYSKTLTVVSGSTDAYGWIRIATGPLLDTFGTFTVNSSATGYHTMVKFTAGYCCYSDSYKQYDLSQLSCIHWRDTASGANSKGISQIRLGVPKTNSGTGFIDIYVPTQKKLTCTLTYKVPDNKNWSLSNSFTTITSAPDTSTYDVYTMDLDSTYSISASKGLKIGGVITQGSDKNIKHNIQDISKKYNQFYNSLQPKQFKYNQDFSNRNRFGFIAQEVEEAYKNADLDYTQDSIIEKHENNKNGEWDLNMMDIIPLNTWQIQQMKQEIELLKQELAELRKLVKKDG